jgi:putative effector of murein hydrolase LrgA (UPF0299 family)
MLAALTQLLVCQLVGEVIARYFALPVPGPVIGFALLFGALLARGAAPAGLRDTANALLGHLSLLFVPAGVGVMVHLDRLGADATAIVASLVGSTVLTIAVTARVFRALAGHRSEQRP